jgi:predicted nucleic acid-binding protein
MDPHSERLIASLTWAEILSGLAKKVRLAMISPSDYGHLERHFRADIRKRQLRPIRVLNAHFTSAGQLISSHGLTRQLRALDAIQLAVALRIHLLSPIDHFVCADQRLCDVAVLQGLAVIQS